MCGRYTLMTSQRSLSELFGVTRSDATLIPRYNIAPTQPVPILRNESDGARVLRMVRWGLVPGWRKDPADGPLLVNARAESVADKPSFRDAFRRRRCLVPADGFYEWKSGPGGARKLPHYVRRIDGTPMAMAGLWERWVAPDGTEIFSCTIITVPAREPVASLHDRMPAAIERADFDTWLDPDTPVEVLHELLLRETTRLEVQPVSRRVNRVENDGPECLAPPEPEPQLTLF